jgi:hypothetical protein
LIHVCVNTALYKLLLCICIRVCMITGHVQFGCISFPYCTCSVRCILMFSSYTLAQHATGQFMKWLIKVARGSKWLMVSRAVGKLLMLANGEWNIDNAKALTHNCAGLRLFESRIDKGARLIWEVCVVFDKR